MRHPHLRLFVLALLVLVVGTALAHQLLHRRALEQERARLADRQLRQRQLADEVARLETARVPFAELARLRALARAAVASASPAPSLPPPASVGPAPVSTATAPGRRPAADWRDAGTATPADTFETFVLAATQGDTERLAALLAFEPIARAGLESTFAGLSEETRTTYGSPEKFVAALLAVQVPRQLAAFTVGQQLPATNGDLAVLVHLETNAASKAPSPTFTFRPAPGGWRLLVPNHVLQGLAHALGVPLPAPPPHRD